MKDAYSFDADLAGLQRSYDAMYDAYGKVFTRCGLTFRSVKAQSGEIGGDTSQEFMAVAAVGEDAFVWCEHCDYAANTEAATRGAAARRRRRPTCRPAQKVHTPDMPGIDVVAEHLGTTADLLMKAIAFDVDGELVLALVPGRPRGQRVRGRRAFPAAAVRLYTDADFAAAPRDPEGLHRARLRRREARHRRLVDPRAARLGHRRERGRPPRAATWCSAATSRRPSGPRSSWSSPATRARAAGSRCASTAASRSATSSSSATSTRRRSARCTPTTPAPSTPWSWVATASA